ncbi:MAG: response regulator [Acidobacteriia bacterium]|nr:response regulator [Terriglobia bacterium]
MSEKKILIIDDDAFIRRPLEFILREEGFLPVTAVDGEDGLAKLEGGRPDLIFLDVMMPGMDGFAVCRRVRTDPRFSSIPVIMLTAKGQEGDRDRGLAAGATEFISKPYSPSELLRRVREILSERTSGSVGT